MEAIILASISALTSIVVAVITSVSAVRQKKSEALADRRREESLLAMELSHANTKLTIGVAMALKHGHCNGEVEDGLEAVNKANDKYEAYIRKIANEALHEGAK